MIIVGLTGGIGHGKTTLADMLAGCVSRYAHLETSEIVMEVANAFRAASPGLPQATDTQSLNAWLMPLGQAVSLHVHADANFEKLGVSAHKLEQSPELFTKLFEYLQLVQEQPELLQVEITDGNKRIFRPFLQWLGGYLVKSVGDGVWYDEIIRRLHTTARVGVQLATVGGLRFPGDAERIRNAAGFVVEIRRPSLQQPDIEDITERERTLIVADTTVINDATLAQLQLCAAQLYQDLAHRSLADRYMASTFNA